MRYFAFILFLVIVSYKGETKDELKTGNRQAQR